MKTEIEITASPASLKDLEEQIDTAVMGFRRASDGAAPEDRTDADLAQYLLGRGLDIESLPTFGGQPPRDTRDVWSWDERHLLVGNGLDIRIVERPDENAE